MRWLAAFAGTLVAGCSCENLGIPNDRFACTVSASCADGYACLDGVCVLGGSVVDGGADGGARDGGAQDGGTDAGLHPDGGPASASLSTAVAAPSSLPADAVSTATVTVTVNDPMGRPLQGYGVVLSSTGSANVFTQPAPTDANGVATGTLASGQAETKTLTATVFPGDVVLTQKPQLTFTAGTAGPLPADGGDCQEYSTIAVNPSTGRLGVAFSQGQALLYTECTANCVTAPQWSTPDVVDPVAFTSTVCTTDLVDIALVFLPNGNPAIAYVQGTSANCPLEYSVKSLGTWQTSQVAFLNTCTVGTTHKTVSMALVGAAQTPAVAFHSANTADAGEFVNYAACISGCDTGSTAWGLQPVAASSGDIGTELSLAVDPVSLLPRMAFSEDTSAVVGYATCADGTGSCAAATGTWTLGQIDGVWPYSISLGFPPDGGSPGASYIAYTTGAVTFAGCTGACDDASGASWVASPVDTVTANLYDYTLLRFDGSGRARIAYADRSTGQLHYAVANGASFALSTVASVYVYDRPSFVLGPPGTDFVFSSPTPAATFDPTGY